jgi:hypothetical protein
MANTSYDDDTGEPRSHIEDPKLWRDYEAKVGEARKDRARMPSRTLRSRYRAAESRYIKKNATWVSQPPKQRSVGAATNTIKTVPKPPTQQTTRHPKRLVSIGSATYELEGVCLHSPPLRQCRASPRCDSTFVRVTEEQRNSLRGDGLTSPQASRE